MVVHPDHFGGLYIFKLPVAFRTWLVKQTKKKKTTSTDNCSVSFAHVGTNMSTK